METHRAVVLDQPGLALDTRRMRQTPNLNPNQVLIRVRACAVNPVDWKVRREGWAVEIWPAVLGSDGAGEIAAIGSQVTRVQVGDRVCFAGWYSDPNSCSFQELAVADDSLVARIPPSMSFESAAGIGLACFTAYISFFHETGAGLPIQLPPAAQALASQMPEDLGPPVPEEPVNAGPSVTILGGSSSVGQFAIQFCRLAGFSRIITTSSPRHHDYLRSLGATDIFGRDASIQDLVRANAAAWAVLPINEVSHLTPIVFDPVGSPTTAATAVSLVRELSKNTRPGMLVSPSVIWDPNLPLDLDYRGIYALAWALPQASVPFYSALEVWLANGSVVPNRHTVVGDLDLADEALNQSEIGVSGVKLVLTV